MNTSFLQAKLRIDLFTAQKMKFSIKDFFSKCDQIIFTEEILNQKLHFLCSVSW